MGWESWEAVWLVWRGRWLSNLWHYKLEITRKPLGGQFCTALHVVNSYHGPVELWGRRLRCLQHQRLGLSRNWGMTMGMKKSGQIQETDGKYHQQNLLWDMGFGKRQDANRFLCKWWFCNPDWEGTWKNVFSKEDNEFCLAEGLIWGACRTSRSRWLVSYWVYESRGWRRSPDNKLCGLQDNLAKPRKWKHIEQKDWRLSLWRLTSEGNRDNRIGELEEGMPRAELHGATASVNSRKCCWRLNEVRNETVSPGW